MKHGEGVLCLFVLGIVALGIAVIVWYYSWVFGG
jgi:hypothetical protein